MALVGATGCGDATVTVAPDEVNSSTKPKDPLATGGSFLALSREVSPEVVSVREKALSKAGAPKAGVDASSSFYLAIAKSSLSKKWFFSTYLRQYFPGAVGGGAARTMGTRIITFQVQNDKLFVFDASSNYTTSGTFDPQVLLEAYPIVTDNAAFNASANASNYLLVDPSAGLNKFSLLSDAFGAGAVAMTIDISFSQRFRAISDGVTWEQVFTGLANQEVGDGTLDGNTLRASGTLGLSVRRYTEGEGYTPTDLPEQEMFFRSENHILPNSGQTYQTAVKWNIHPGMKPIVWKLAANVGDLKADPYWAQYDIEGALKAGIENWNQAFGFEALKAELGTANDSAGDDDKNVVLFDEDPSYGAAFANWRENPNTGEIRGASIYFSSLWLYGADAQFTDDPGVAASIKGTRPASADQYAAARAVPNTTTISWKAMPYKQSCVMWAPQYRALNADDAAEFAAVPTAATPSATKMTKKQKVEAYLTAILVHEIGHTLGLRHNFKGSLVPPSSSVMEYMVDNDRILAATPQAYDVAAIKYLYDMSKELPTQPFCTDNAVRTDPDCTMFDVGADPLTQLYAPTFVLVKNDFLMGKSSVAPNVTANNLLKYIRAGTDKQAAFAWQVAFDGISPPISKALLDSSPVYGAAADALSARLLTRMWSDAATLRGTFIKDPPRTAAIMNGSLQELSGNLNNLDNVRSFTNRRACVDILKYFQVTPAYQVLTDSRAKIAYDATKLSGTPALLTQDLLSRIDAVTSPYFVK